VSEAPRTTYAATAEAKAARNRIGLAKLMGRDSGFIAAYSVLVDSQVNVCLVPEVPFSLDGLLATHQTRLERRGHAA
jgi:6-phosphofructokinase 1